MQERYDEHRPVLLDEALEGLNIRPDGVYVDGTFGRGGHAREILARLGGQGQLLAIDKDPGAVRVAREQLAGDERFSIVRGSFAMLGQLARDSGVAGRIDGVLLDLGVSSPQLDDPSRGFSFMKSGPLDMRMDPDTGVPASAWLQSASERELSEVLHTLGEERFHKRIARAIVAARAEAPIPTTDRLVEIVSAAVPTREPGKHPATRTFQAIRIHINRELEDIERTLPQAVDVLAPGGRLVVISFHSLEDRIVKRFIRGESRGEDRLPRGLPVTSAQVHNRLRPVGKAVRPGAAEVEANPRARSAVLRIAERLA